MVVAATTDATGTLKRTVCLLEMVEVLDRENRRQRWEVAAGLLRSAGSGWGQSWLAAIARYD
jgi:hypothetical protein